ncbi:MAG: PilZ domain-containing protein, partial [Planctomycetota bacterium]
MLDRSVPIDLTENVWEALPVRANLPCDEDSYLVAKRPGRGAVASRRAYRRVDARAKAVVNAEGQWLAIYVQDVSAAGVGFYSPVQLFPKQSAVLLISDFPKVELQIRRCRRLDAKCFFIGGL